MVVTGDNKHQRIRSKLPCKWKDQKTHYVLDREELHDLKGQGLETCLTPWISLRDKYKIAHPPGISCEKRREHKVNGAGNNSKRLQPSAFRVQRGTWSTHVNNWYWLLSLWLLSLWLFPSTIRSNPFWIKFVRSLRCMGGSRPTLVWELREGGLLYSTSNQQPGLNVNRRATALRSREGQSEKSLHGLIWVDRTLFCGRNLDRCDHSLRLHRNSLRRLSPQLQLASMTTFEIRTFFKLLSRQELEFSYTK